MRRPQHLCCGLTCPVRPSIDGSMQDGEGWADIEQGPLEALAGENREAVMADDEMNHDDGSVSRVPRGLPEPYVPDAATIVRHNLTHWPYAPWCEHCVRSRRPNSPHPSAPSSPERSLPVFVADYCFLKDNKDDDTTTVVVGKLYPSRTIFASVVSEKGSGDETAVRLLADFFKETGVVKLVYKSDQEPAIKSYLDAALKQVGAASVMDDDLVICAIPEHSAVGASASNGKAERSVQILKDQVRTLKSAIESNLKTRLPISHPMIHWLVRHCCTVLNRCSVNPDGRTPYQTLH